MLQYNLCLLRFVNWRLLICVMSSKWEVIKLGLPLQDSLHIIVGIQSWCTQLSIWKTNIRQHETKQLLVPPVMVVCQKEVTLMGTEAIDGNYIWGYKSPLGNGFFPYFSPTPHSPPFVPISPPPFLSLFHNHLSLSLAPFLSPHLSVSLPSTLFLPISLPLPLIISCVQNFQIYAF